MGIAGGFLEKPDGCGRMPVVGWSAGVVSLFPDLARLPMTCVRRARTHFKTSRRLS